MRSSSKDAVRKKRSIPAMLTDSVCMTVLQLFSKIPGVAIESISS